MRINYLVILNYSTCEIITIKLTKEQKRKARTFVNIEDYVASLEGTYHFKISECAWMASENLMERSYM